ncbi:MAG: retroviral-like aspartic protease family protein [Candidatus Sabulitectum sp.]|nr:retroviral-like aspartic protease family protein [Candidatus Sabulitectum sp.]
MSSKSKTQKSLEKRQKNRQKKKQGKPFASIALKSNGGLLNVLRTPARISIAASISQVENPTMTEFKAIWDTGATHTAISNQVASQCNLQPVSRVKVSTASGNHVTNVYFVDVVLLNEVIFRDVRVTEAILADGIDVLVGMDIINQGDFAVTNKDKSTMMSFRVPPGKHIDFNKK